VIFTRIIVSTAWSLWYFGVVLDFFRCSYDSFLFGELALIGIKSNRALWVVVFKAFGLWKAKRYFGRWIIHTMSLYFFVSGYRNLIHLIFNFIKVIINVIVMLCFNRCWFELKLQREVYWNYTQASSHQFFMLILISAIKFDFILKLLISNVYTDHWLTSSFFSFFTKV